MLATVKFVGVLLIAALSACTVFPRSGPTHQEIIRDASERHLIRGSDPNINYVVVDISADILPYFDVSLAPSLRDGFGTGQGTAPTPLLGVGDVVSVTVFESQAGGLFTPLDSRAEGNFIRLPDQVIDREGNITVPYVGAIRLAGRPVSEVQDEIEDLLANRAIEPQVIISTTLSRSNRLSILGDVNAPAEMDLSPRGERILDIIARAGGLRAPGDETYVTIERDGRLATALFRSIVETPSENIFVEAGDTIYVYRERRTYLAFGAAGLNGRFDFEESDLTLAEALGKAGGLLDSRADPSEVFLYRLVPAPTLSDAGLFVGGNLDTMVPVIFRANLSDPRTFFAVQRFSMQDKDLLYVSNSASTDLSKFLDLINGVSNTIANVPVNAVNTRNALQDLTN